jgi:hypothetical protein
MSKLADADWPNADLFFLTDALRHGMTVAEVAGFLGKTSVRRSAGQGGRT